MRWGSLVVMSLGEPRCFLHVPKCAGTSIHVALEAAFPEGAVASRRSDTSVFCDFSAFDRIDEQARALVAVGDAEISALARYRVVSGHFSLPTLLRLTPASNIATVLREPRTRLLSAFMFLRLTPIVGFWGPYGQEVLSSPAQAIETCFSDERIARSNDNQACRLLLHGDPRLPDGRFVDPGDVQGVAEAALERLDRLGYVGILERDDVWGDLSRFFGVTLEPVRTNVTGEGEMPQGALPIPSFDMEAVLDLIDRRCAADQIVYDALLDRHCADRDEARRVADAAFAEELVRFGNLTGPAATELSRLAAATG